MYLARYRPSRFYGQAVGALLPRVERVSGGMALGTGAWNDGCHLRHPDMLIWRLRIPREDGETSPHIEVVCHVQKRDAAYRLIMRSDGALVVDETHESIFAAARR